MAFHNYLFQLKGKGVSGFALTYPKQVKNRGWELPTSDIILNILKNNILE